MNCEDFGKRLDNYENLTEQEKADLNVHAGGCEKCREELDFFLSMIASVRSLPKIEPPADFMDKLSVRLDSEDKKAAPKMLKHLRRNWMQYTAAAACFALVAVFAASQGFWLTPSQNDVISQETTIADKTDKADKADKKDTEKPAETTVPAKNDTASSPSPDKTSDTGTAAEGMASAPPSASPAAKSSKTGGTSVFATAKPAATASAKSTASPSRASLGKTSSVVSSPSSTASPSGRSTAAPQSTPSALAETASPSVTAAPASQTPSPASVPTDAPAQTAEPSGSDNSGYELERSGDYGIALASVVRSDEDGGVEYDLRASEIRDSYTLDSEEESIAYGRYYVLDKYGNRADEAEAVGSLKIRSKDADKAMDILRQYPHDEDGEVYATDSENLSNILEDMDNEGIDYTNYTMDGNNDVRFRVVFN